MTWFILYVFVIADQLREALSNFGGVGFLLFMSTFLTIFFSCILNEHEFSVSNRKTARKICYSIGFIFITMATLHTLIPTQKNLALLIGAGVTYEAVTSEEGKRIGGKLIDLLEQKIDESLGGEVIEVPKAKVSGKEI